MHRQPYRKSDRRGTEPSETEIGKRQVFACYLSDHGAVYDSYIRIERHKPVVYGGKQRKADRPRVNTPVVSEKFPEQGEKYQNDRQRIKEHQNRQGIGDYTVQSEVCEKE